MRAPRCDVWLVRSSLRGRRLLDAVLAPSFVAPGWELGRRCGVCGGTDHGRPVLPWPGAPSVSLSYTDGWGAVALAGGPVGVDVERRFGRSGLEALAEWVWTPAERVRARGVPDWSGRLYRDWTRKEAVLKAHGVGLSVPMSTFEGGRRLVRVPGFRPLAVFGLGRWSPPGVVAAVAVAPGVEVRVRVVSGPVTPRR